MLARVQTIEGKPLKSNSLFLPQLDGLRFLAFLAVFIHHAPSNDAVPGWNTIKHFGWFGVEVFFVISAYLFFHLLVAERQKTGRISTLNFYLRRCLRILPLLWFYTLAMFLFYSDHSYLAMARTATIMMGTDNIVAWVNGYSAAVPATGHLWTLSFELQVYLAIPLAFIAYQKFGKKVFFCSLLVIWIYCLVLRTALATAGAVSPIVWVTPILRPEAILLGLALSLSTPQWTPLLSVAGATVALFVLAVLPIPATPLGMIFTYPVTGVAGALIVDAVLRQKQLGQLLSSRPLQFLGRVSFGLYVFHFLGMDWGQNLLAAAGLPSSPAGSWRASLLWLATTLTVTLALAVVSYYAIERPILNIKSRKYSAVEGRDRPIAST